MFPILKLIIFIFGFSTKVTHAFLASEIKEKLRFQRYRACHSINGGSLEIMHVSHLSKITSYRKKISHLPLTKKVSLKKPAFRVNNKS